MTGRVKGWPSFFTVLQIRGYMDKTPFFPAFSTHGVWQPSDTRWHTVTQTVHFHASFWPLNSCPGLEHGTRVQCEASSPAPRPHIKSAQPCMFRPWSSSENHVTNGDVFVMDVVWRDTFGYGHGLMEILMCVSTLFDFVLLTTARRVHFPHSHEKNRGRISSFWSIKFLVFWCHGCLTFMYAGFPCRPTEKCVSV